MNKEQNIIDLAMLRIKSLIIDKEHINKRIESDIIKYGEPQCDYGTWYEETNAQIDEGFKEVGGYLKEAIK